MLTKPLHGWSAFQLEGTSVYQLSYVDDIASEWIDQAMHGLETLSPFCVRGFMEPNRFLCTVSYWNCHIICEDEDRYPLDQEDLFYEYSHTSMLQFCISLYDDVKRHMDEWVSFPCYREEEDFPKWKELLIQRLTRFKELIAESKEHFGEHRGFF